MTQKKGKAGSIASITAHGEERADLLPMFPHSSAHLGAAAIGIYAGADSFNVKDTNDKGEPTGKMREVHFVKLRNAVTFMPDAEGSAEGELLQHDLIGVPLNADTKNKLDPASLRDGMALHITLRDRDAQFNNMKRYTVKVIGVEDYARIWHSAGE